MLKRNSQFNKIDICILKIGYKLNQWTFLRRLASPLFFMLGWAVFLSILYFIRVMLSFFFLLSYSGEIVFDNLEVIFEDSIFCEVISRTYEVPSVPYL